MSRIGRQIPFFILKNHTLQKQKSLKKIVFLDYLNHAKHFATYGCQSFCYRLMPLQSPAFWNLQNRKISKDSQIENHDESTQKAILEDEELQNILRDFAKDFDVDEESSKVLDDIRKSQDLTKDEEIGPSNESAVGSDTLVKYESITSEKYKEYRDDDSSVIQSIEEDPEEVFHIDKEHQARVTRLDAKRGVTGVYDIEELVAILREEKLYDIAVISIPEIYHYASYLVLANAKSARHAKAVSESIVKHYKRKKNKSDPFVKIEGEKIGSWKAIDMGNIVLHIFLEDTRESYDIESLWLFDSVYDSGGKVENEDEVNILEEQAAFLESLKLNEVPNSDQQSTQ